MNSRERVLTSLRHVEPDRVPLDSGSCSTTSISALAYSKLKRHLGINYGTIAVYDVIQQLAMPEDWYLDKFEVDVVDLTREFCLNTSGWQEWRLNDGTIAKIPPWIQLDKRNGEWLCRNSDGDILARMPAGGFFFDQTHWPLLNAAESEYIHPERHFPNTMWGAMLHPLMHLYSDPEFPRLLRQAAKYLYENTEQAIMLNAGISLFEKAQYLCRSDQLLVDMIVNPKRVEALLDRLLELNLERLEVLLDAVGSFIHVIKINDDFGTQDRPMISPKLFRDVYKPRHKIMCDFIHQKLPDVCVFLHSCGSINAFIPDLIEIGVDIINPVQIAAADMEPIRLKKEYGKDLTFWGGGADTQRILPFKTPQEVTDHVKEMISIFAPGGGFVFTQSHNITPDVQPENIIAMFEAHRRFKTYHNRTKWSIK